MPPSGVGRGLLGFAERDALARAFHDAAVPAVWLRGAVWADQLYDQPGERPFEDLDVWIRPPDVAAAEAVLAGLGYRPARSGERVWVRAAGERPIDLHDGLWHLTADEAVAAWDRAVSVSPFVKALAPVDAAMELVAHAVVHHPEPRRQWIEDAARMWSLWSKPIEAAGVVERWIARGWAAPAGRLALAARWPAAVVERLGAVGGWRAFAYRRIIQVGGEPAGHLLRILFSPSRARFVARQIFPGAQFLSRRYGGAPWVCAVWRPVDLVRRALAVAVRAAGVGMLLAGLAVLSAPRPLSAQTFNYGSGLIRLPTALVLPHGAFEVGILGNIYENVVDPDVAGKSLVDKNAFVYAGLYDRAEVGLTFASFIANISGAANAKINFYHYAPRRSRGITGLDLALGIQNLGPSNNKGPSGKPDIQFGGYEVETPNSPYVMYSEQYSFAKQLHLGWHVGFGLGEFRADSGPLKPLSGALAAAQLAVGPMQFIIEEDGRHLNGGGRIQMSNGLTFHLGINGIEVAKNDPIEGVQRSINFGFSYTNLFSIRNMKMQEMDLEELRAKLIIIERGITKKGEVSDDSRQLAKKYVRDAAEVWRQGQYEEAMTLLGKGAEFNPYDPELKSALTKLKGITEVTARETGGGKTADLFRRGLTAFIEGRAKTALSTLYYVTTLSPGNAKAQRLLRLASLEYPSIAYEERIQPGMNLVEHKLYKALYAIYEDKFTVAVEDCADVLELEPDNVLALTRLGSAYYALGQKDKAREVWSRALSLDPGNKELRSYLGSGAVAVKQIGATAKEQSAVGGAASGKAFDDSMAYYQKRVAAGAAPPERIKILERIIEKYQGQVNLSQIEAELATLKAPPAPGVTPDLRYVQKSLDEDLKYYEAASRRKNWDLSEQVNHLDEILAKYRGKGVDLADQERRLADLKKSKAEEDRKRAQAAVKSSDVEAQRAARQAYEADLVYYHREEKGLTKEGKLDLLEKIILKHKESGVDVSEAALEREKVKSAP